MTVVVAYQSLNSSASGTHDLAATTSKTFLRLAQKNLASLYTDGSGALQYPQNSVVDPHEAIQGPASLVSVADGNYMDVKKPKKSLKRKRDDQSGLPEPKFQKAQQRTLSMVEGKARQIYQQAYREMSAACDLIAFGELNSSHPDWNSISRSAGDIVHNAVNKRACNCFSLHSSQAGGLIRPVDQGEGWCAARCKNALVVFVHVPNKYAKSKSSAVNFYSGIKTRVLNAPGGGVVDVIIGDTNQSSLDFSQKAINQGMDLSFENAGTKSSYSIPSDTWSRGQKVKHGGTNAGNDKPYDVALFNTGTVRSIEVSYISQFSVNNNKAAAYTDHMGLLVKIEKK